jgi:hypothetical protein
VRREIDELASESVQWWALAGAVLDVLILLLDPSLTLRAFHASWVKFISSFRITRISKSNAPHLWAYTRAWKQSEI